MERHQNNSANNSTSPSQIIDSKLAMYWERFAIYIACSLVALCAWLYVKQEEKIAQLDVKVQQLQIDKVSKQELREMEERISKNMDGMKGDIIFHINMLREKR